MYPSYMLNAVAGNNGLPSTGMPFIDAFTGKMGSNFNIPHTGIPFIDAFAGNGGQGLTQGLAQWLGALGIPGANSWGSGNSTPGANAWNNANNPATTSGTGFGQKIGDGMSFPMMPQWRGGQINTQSPGLPMRNYAVSSVPTSGQTQLNTNTQSTPSFGSPSEGVSSN